MSAVRIEAFLSVHPCSGGVAIKRLLKQIEQESGDREEILFHTGSGTKSGISTVSATPQPSSCAIWSSLLALRLAWTASSGRHAKRDWIRHTRARRTPETVCPFSIRTANRRDASTARREARRCTWRGETCALDLGAQSNRRLGVARVTAKV
jgi:hypothetical protein